MLQSLTAPLLNKILGGFLAGSLLLSGGLGIALAIKSGQLDSAKEVIQDLSQWQDDMVTTVSLATGNPDITPLTAKPQIQQLGMDLVRLEGAISTQNEAVSRLEEQTLLAREIAEQERLERQDAVQDARQAQVQLRELTTTTVPRSEMEGRIRELQDIIYEAGL